MLVLEYLGLMRWDRQPGKALQTQWNLAKVEQRVAVWTAGCKTEEKKFVRHPNILFGQLAVLGWRPRFPFVEFRERVAVRAAFWTHTSLEIWNLKWYNCILHCSVPLKQNDIQIHTLLKLETLKTFMRTLVTVSNLFTDCFLKVLQLGQQWCYEGHMGVERFPDLE